MQKIKRGDVFEVKTNQGRGYVQYLKHDDFSCALVRVFPKHFMEAPSDLANIIKNSEYYYVGYLVDYAYKEKLVDFVGNYKVPRHVTIPKKMMLMENYKGTYHWNIVDVKTLRRREANRNLTKDRKLSPFGYWSHDILQLRIEQEWTPETWETFLDLT